MIITARKKPVTINALQFTNDSNKFMNEFIQFTGHEVVLIQYENNKPKLLIETLEGTMKASIGDYIIRGVDNEIYPCKPDIFHKTYDIIGDDLK